MKVDFFPPVGGATLDPRGAEWAASIGYDGYFTAEASHDPFLPLAVAAASGADLDLGTAIAVAFARSPMVTAMTAWDLAMASRGRFLLGLGTQVKAHITRRFSMEWSAPADRMREYVQAVRAIWDSWQHRTRLRFDGDHYSFSLMTPFFDPGPIDFPGIPIYVAGVGPRMAAVAGEVCDGLHVHPLHTVKYLDEVVLPNIARGAANTGRDPSAVSLASTVFVVTGRDAAELEAARGAAARQIAFYASTPTYRGVLETHDWEIGPELSAMSRRGRWDEMAALIDDEILDTVAVVAPFDEIGDRIRRRYGGRIARVGHYFAAPVPGLTDELRTRLVAGTRG